MKDLLKLLLISILLFILINCNKTTNDNKIIVGISADNPPFEFIQDNQLVGMEIDLIKEVAQKLNKEIVFKNLEFNHLFPALENNNIDLAIAGLSVTDDRKARFSFSSAYLNVPVVILHRFNDPIKAIEDLNNKILGFQTESVWKKMLEDLFNNINFKPLSLTNNLMLIEALKSKSIDAVIIEEAQAKEFVANNNELSYFVIEPIHNQQLAIAFRNNSSLLPLVDNAIKELENEGKIKIIMAKWLKP